MHEIKFTARQYHFSQIKPSQASPICRLPPPLQRQKWFLHRPRLQPPRPLNNPHKRLPLLLLREILSIKRDRYNSIYERWLAAQMAQRDATHVENYVADLRF